MGQCCSCCDDTSKVITPDLDTRRKQQAEAAERRMKIEESRGVKDPARVKRQLQQNRVSQTEANVSTPLKWQVG